MSTWQSPDHLIWIDLEMNGLEPERHTILEIATIVTDSNLVVLEEGPVFAVQHPDSIVDAMDDWNITHHTDSGLIKRVLASEVTMGEAEQRTLDFVAKYTVPGKSPLCGNSIGQDRRFLRKYMPTLHAHFHYRSIDVSSFKEMIRRWYPSMSPFYKNNAHLALDDIRESIAELRYYRRNAFIPPAADDADTKTA